MTGLMDANIIDFFRLTTEHEPIEIEKKILLSFLDTSPAYLKVAIASGRQCGKSLTSAVGVAFLSLHSEKKITIAVVSAKENHVYENLRDIFNRCPELRDYLSFEGSFSVVPLKGYEIKSTRTKVLLISATARSLRGVSADWILIDEAGQFTDNMLQTAMLCRANNEAKLTLISTVHVYKSTFNSIVKSPAKYGYILYTWSMKDCPWKLKQIEDFEHTLTKERFKAEVLGQPLTENEKSLFEENDILKLIDDEIIAEGSGKYLEVGIDFGTTRSPILVEVIERKGTEQKLLLTAEFLDERAIYRIIKAVEVIRSLKRNYIIKADSQPEGLWKLLIEAGIPKEKVFPVDARVYKEYLVGQLKRAIETHSLHISSKETKLLDQLRDYRRGLNFGDDYVDALALAIFQNDDLIHPEVKHGIATGTLLDTGESWTTATPEVRPPLEKLIPITSKEWRHLSHKEFYRRFSPLVGTARDLVTNPLEQHNTIDEWMKMHYRRID